LRRIAAFLLVLLLCAPFFAVGAQDDRSILRVGVVAPVTLDPHLGTNDPEILFNRQIYDYLIDVGPESDLIPQLASEWEISEDGLAYTLMLEEGVAFHDGTPFTSADVVFSFQRLQQLESPALNLLGEFEIEAPDETTVTFTLPEPNADFLYGIGSRWSLVLKDGAEDVNVLTEDLSNFVGTGPFVLQSYSDGEGAELIANEDYWLADQPQLSGLNIVFINEQQAKIDAVRSGSIDATIRLSADRIEELRSFEGVEVLTRPTNLHPVIRLRTAEGLLGEDPRVMQAIKLATDRELLVLDLFGEGVAVVGNNDPVGPAYGQFYIDIPDEYDPEAACALLAEAGYPDGLGADEPLQLFVVDAFNYPDMAVLLQDQWAQAGCIDVELLVIPENVYYGDNAWLEVEFGVTGWGSRPIPQQYFTEAYVGGATFNETNFDDAEVNDLVAQAAVTTDVEERAAIYQQIAQVFAERGPIIVPFFAPTVGATSDRVEGLELNAFPGRTDFRSVSLGE